MKRVITYGTFDLLHYGHINLLRRAKQLGDYLIVALSTDDDYGDWRTPIERPGTHWKLIFDLENDYSCYDKMTKEEFDKLFKDL